MNEKLSKGHRILFFKENRAHGSRIERSGKDKDGSEYLFVGKTC